MPIFTYSARPATGGEMQTGELELASKDEVMAHLTRQRLIPVSVREKPKEINITFGTGVSTRDIVIFTRQFATMINSGLPLVQSLDILAEQTENQALRKTISEVLYDVESGHTLADANAAGSVGPSFDGNANLDKAHAVQVLNNGQGPMPSFSWLGEEDIDLIASYLVQVKK